MEIWVVFTLIAACMQSIRTAGQKKIAINLSPSATTLVRYLFGLPFALMYLFTVTSTGPIEAMTVSIRNSEFLAYASLASVAQILATVWLVKVFSFRNFAVATIFSKTEAIQTAILGAIFFGSFLSWWEWFAVILGAIGIAIMSLPSKEYWPDPKGVFYGMLSGLGFAFTALWLRQASLSLGYTYIENAAVTLTYMVSVQAAICLLYILAMEKDQIFLIKNHLPLAALIGMTSTFGSVGWYTAMTYENAALVRSLGQAEILFAVAISYFFFKEKISGKEALGVSAITCGVLILLVFN